jgi:hypothetical protein
VRVATIAPAEEVATSGAVALGDFLGRPGACTRRNSAGRRRALPDGRRRGAGRKGVPRLLVPDGGGTGRGDGGCGRGEGGGKCGRAGGGSEREVYGTAATKTAAKAAKQAAAKESADAAAAAAAAARAMSYRFAHTVLALFVIPKGLW